MKTKIIISTLLATLLLGSSVNASALHDSVAQKEQNALSNKSVQGEAAAQAQIEELNAKEQFLAKQKLNRFSQEAKQDKAKQVRKNVNQELSNHTPKAGNAPKEVLNGFRESILAIQALNTNKIDEAKKALKNASDFFTKALKNNPSLGLVAIADDVKVDTFEGDSKLAKKLVKTAKELLEDYETQAARAILLPMKDEMSVSTEYLPMKIYPDAIKQAQKALNSGNTDLCVSILMTALDTVVIETVTMPISLLTAQDLINVAAKLDKSKKKEATNLLNIADDELEKAVILGYIKKYQSEYKDLKKEIKDLKKEIKGKNRVEKLYESLKSNISSLISKIRKDVSTNK